MDLHQLRVFRAAALHGGFTRASEQLHLSQSTVSLHIKQLEAELGCLLFSRIGRRVELNATGSLLLEYSERIFRDLKNAEMAVHEMRSLRQGTVRFGTGATTLTYRLPSVLAAYRRRFPKVELIVVTGTTEGLVQEVKAQRVDLSLVMLPVNEAGLDVKPVGRERLIIVVHRDHPVYRARALTPECLQGLPFILYQPQSAMQSLIDQWFSVLGVVPRVTMRIENIEAIKSLVRAQLGVAVLPQCALRDHTKSDPLRVLQVRGVPLDRKLGIVTADEGVRPKAVQALIGLISEALT